MNIKIYNKMTFKALSLCASLWMITLGGLLPMRSSILSPNWQSKKFTKISNSDYSVNQNKNQLQAFEASLLEEIDMPKEIVIDDFPIIYYNGSFHGSIENSGDQDFFRINAKHDKIVILSLNSDSDLYPLLDVIDSKGNIVSKPHSFDSSVYKMGILELDSSTAPFLLRIKSQGNQNGDYVLKCSFLSRVGIKNEVIRLTNVERNLRQLLPLVHNSRLEAAAQLHVEDMNSSGRYLAHTGSNGSTPEDRIKLSGYRAAWHDNGDGSLMYIRQENAAYGQLSAAEVVSGWMNSPGHRAAILAPEAEEIGIGFEIDKDSGIAYWVQTFGIPWTFGDKDFF